MTFTVKHCDPSGHESISTAESVAFLPPSRDNPHAMVMTYRGPIVGGMPVSEGLRFDDGVVYVMNGEGSTVSKYDLGAYHAFNG